MTGKLLLAAGAVLSFAVTGAAIPLPEHPRPDWERAEWMNLNGEWDFGFSETNLDRRIVVPFSWGSRLSGINDEAGTEGDTGYYRRSVIVPKAWRGRRVFVVVGAADHDTTCVFDGHGLGKHSGGYTPFEFELTPYVKWGKAQTLSFSVWDAPGGSDGRLFAKQCYGNVRGIWQTVYLEARGEAYLDSVRLTPSIARKSVKAELALDAPAVAPLTAHIRLDGRTTDVSFAAGERTKTVEIGLANPRLWTLEDPYLYDVEVGLRQAHDNKGGQQAHDNKGGDVVKTYFGFREVGVGKNPNGDSYVTLNGKPVYLRLCLDQSFHPDGLYTFPSDEFMRNEMLLTKRLALTGNRVHIKAEVPRKLYWADRLGLLIQADVPCAWGDACELMFGEHWACFADMVKRDFNHPCIYQWTLFNETWGLFSHPPSAAWIAAGKGPKDREYREETQRRVAEAYARAKRLDPTRLVEDNSATWHDHVVTDVNTWHRYRPGYLWERTVAEWCDGTYPGSTRNFIGGRRQDGAPMMNSECGNVWGYAGSTGDCDFSWDYHLMMNAFSRHLKCAGWTYTEHHDVINEWNGYVRDDRSSKFDGMDELAGMTLADFHRDAAIFFAGTPGRETGEFLAPGQEIAIPVGVSLTTDKYAGKTLELVASGGSFEAKTAKSWQCETLWTHRFVAPSAPSCGCVVYKVKADGKEIARNFWSFGVTNAAPATVVASKAEWSGGTTNVLGGLKLNGFGKGFFEFDLDAPAAGGVFRAELSSRPITAKDLSALGAGASELECVTGGGFRDRTKSANSYPMTSTERHPSRVRVVIGGRTVKELTLENDPCDHRGILSWLSQQQDGRLHEAGTYGWLVEAPVPAEAVKGGRVTVRLEADNGLAVYGPRFGRYPVGVEIW